MQPIRRVGEQVAMLVHSAALDRRVRPKRRERLIEAGAAIDNDQFRSSQAARDQVVEQSPPSRFALPTMFLIASSTFCPSTRTPNAISSQMDVALVHKSAACGIGKSLE